MEVFEGAPWRVELEQEMALSSQLLDVAIIEATEKGTASHSALKGHCQPHHELPDGLENLRPHNLLTYKSQHEPLNAWTLDELIGHYVNYRKLRRQPNGKRHRRAAFGLYAVATRFPRKLARRYRLQATAWEGVYELPWGAHQVRLIVLNGIAKHPRNAPWELFASEQDRLRQGLIHYRARYPNPRRGGHGELFERLYLIYRRENPTMAYTMEDFLRETHELVLANMTPEERLKGLDPEEIFKHYAPEERLKGLDPEERIKGLDPEERLKGLDPEERIKGLDPEERLKGLDPEERLKGLDQATIEAWLAKQRRDH
ncbi:MAG: hypothetical protein C1943_01645 [Halochromatium sp.]|nr:hypothetical protein [Halochromatium sp.]